MLEQIYFNKKNMDSNNNLVAVKFDSSLTVSNLSF